MQHELVDDRYSMLDEGHPAEVELKMVVDVVDKMLRHLKDMFLKILHVTKLSHNFAPQKCSEGKMKRKFCICD